jgi:hypothetical protein
VFSFKQDNPNNNDISLLHKISQSLFFPGMPVSELMASPPPAAASTALKGLQASKMNVKQDVNSFPRKKF